MRSSRAGHNLATEGRQGERVEGGKGFCLEDLECSQTCGFQRPVKPFVNFRDCHKTGNMEKKKKIDNFLFFPNKKI